MLLKIFYDILSESLHSRTTGKGDTASGNGKDKVNYYFV